MDRERIINTTFVALTKSFLKHKRKNTPGGDEYARRAHLALKRLREEDFAGCQKLCLLIVVK